MSSTLRQHFWVFGHPVNSLYRDHYNVSESTLSAVDSLPYFGATNLFLVPMWVQVDKDHEMELAKHVPKVCWSINSAARNPQNVTELVELAKKYPNICSGIFDDFFSTGNPYNNYLNYTVESVRAFREELHAAGLEMWVVLYSHELDELETEVLEKFIPEFDGVTFWFWKEQAVIDGFDDHVERFLQLSQGKRKMIGCYLHDFGGEKLANPDVIISQLDKERVMLKNGDIDAVILHTNAVVTEKSEWIMDRVRAWMQQHGDEIIE